MKTVTLDYLRKKVRASLDELGLNDASFISTDNDSIEFNAVVDSKVEEAVTYVHSNALHHYLDGDVLDTSSLKQADGVGFIDLPADFMRLVVLKMKEWQYPVTSIITEYDIAYKKQKNIYTRGGFDSPVCAITKGEKDILELYTVDGSNMEVEKAFYIPVPKVVKTDFEDTIKICEKLEIPIVNYLAGLTLLVYKDEHADSFFNLVKQYQ